MPVRMQCGRTSQQHRLRWQSYGPSERGALLRMTMRFGSMTEVTSLSG